jgi:hypothetical protein
MMSDKKTIKNKLDLKKILKFDRNIAFYAKMETSIIKQLTYMKENFNTFLRN